jgi:hypothetical protein
MSKYDVKINNPFVCLNSLFVNGRGQLATNLETSRSPLAVCVRKQRQAEEGGFKSVEELECYEKRNTLLDEVQSLQDKLKATIKERDEVLKEGVATSAEGSTKIIRIAKFRRGNRLAQEIREIRERISTLKQGL